MYSEITKKNNEDLLELENTVDRHIELFYGKAKDPFKGKMDSQMEIEEFLDHFQENILDKITMRNSQFFAQSTTKMVKDCLAEYDKSGVDTKSAPEMPRPKADWSKFELTQPKEEVAMSSLSRLEQKGSHHYRGRDVLESKIEEEHKMENVFNLKCQKDSVDRKYFNFKKDADEIFGISDLNKEYNYYHPKKEEIDKAKLEGASLLRFNRKI